MQTNSTKPQNVTELVALIESSRNQYAIRFEPSFAVAYTKSILIEKYNLVTHSTANVIGKTSWGMFQIMGVNIYHLGYQKQIGEFLCSLEDQMGIFKKYLEVNGIDFTLDELRESQEKREKFAKRYNGSIAYAKKIEALL